MSIKSRGSLIVCLLGLVVATVMTLLQSVISTQYEPIARRQDHRPRRLLQAIPVVTSEGTQDAEEIWYTRYSFNDTNTPFSTTKKLCKPTTQFQLLIHQDGWMLQSMDGMGQNKTMGGDELYVTYRDYSQKDRRYVTHVAYVQDLSNGRYSLNFSTTPLDPNLVDLLGIGEVIIHLQFTCDIGTMPQPTKDAWVSGSSSGIRFELQNISIPPFERFTKPLIKSDWTTEHRVVISFGDSIMQQFVRKHRNETFDPRMVTVGNVARPLNTRTLQSILDFLELWHGSQLETGGVGLVLGSAIWDLCHPERSEHSDFKDHALAMRQYLNLVREKYPLVTIYWKLPYAIHPHVVDIPTCVTNPRCAFMTRYMSTSRSRQLYELQKEIVQEMGVKYLDFWAASFLSANWMRSNDGRHYQPEFNKYVLSWYWNGQHSYSIE